MSKTQHNNAKRNRRLAFTLLETTIVLAIASFIFAAIWSAASRVWENNGVDNVLQETVKSVDNIRDTYVGIQDWTMAPLSLSNDTDITRTLDGYSGVGLLPVEMRGNPNTPGATPLYHTLSHTAAGGTCATSGGSFCVLTEGRNFRVALTGLTQSACNKFLMALPINNTSMGILNLIVNGTTQEAYSTSTLSWSPVLPYTSATVAGWCGNTGAANEIDVDFRLH